jgi:hypothetical protein
MYIITREGLGQGEGATSWSRSFNPPAVIIPRPSTFAHVEYEVKQILANPAAARRWRQAGNLLADDLYITHPSRDNNRFRPAAAFNGANKCNVFILDMAWRSGFRVPLLNIGTPALPRYSYPRANSLTTYAARALRHGDRALRGTDGTQWGWVATQTAAAQINANIARGDESPLGGRMYVIVGWRRNGTGHAGIIKRIVSKTNDTGRIGDIIYEGWEATSGQGAQSFVARRWRIAACGQLTGHCTANPAGNALSVFCAIHIIGLLPESVEGRRGALTGLTNVCSLV